jgi:hypothetical protein
MSKRRTLLSVLVLILMLILMVMPALTLASEPLPNKVTAGNWDNGWEGEQPQGTIWYRGG